MKFFEELKAKKEMASTDSALFQDMIRKNSINNLGPNANISNGVPSMVSSASSDFTN
jgi:hypothetical protein